MTTRLLTTILLLAFLAPSTATAMNIHMVFDGQVVEERDDVLVYSGTARIRDNDSPEDDYVTWMRKLRINVNGVFTTLADQPRTETANGYHVYDWTLEIPRTDHITVKVRDITNGHLFFGGWMTSAQPPALAVHGSESYTNCGDAGSDSDQGLDARGRPLTLIADEARARTFDRIAARRAPAR